MNRISITGRAERILRLRKRLGLTQVAFAELLGVSFVTVNRWENGKSEPSDRLWEEILKHDPQRSATAPMLPGPQMELGRACGPTAAPVVPDFTGDPNITRMVVEGDRLSFGHLFNPTFATEAALIDPLPHQRIAVYEHMLTQPRLRFLLADDAGAGKTIMAGLYIREMLARRLIRRVLIVPPAGLASNWRRELSKLLGLHFNIVVGSDARLGNPFTGPNGDLVIAKLDTLAGENMFKRLQEDTTTPYDLVVFDEAHKLSADRDPDYRMRRTDRYRLAEALCGVSHDTSRWRLGWQTRHVLLLTATPHMGKDFPYYCLWRLLEPEVLSTFDAFNEYPAGERGNHFIRRTKEEMVGYDGVPIYKQRQCDTLPFDLTQGLNGEQELYDATTEYIRFYYNKSRVLNRSAARLAMSVFQRRMASSTYALKRSLERRLERLDKYIADMKAGAIDEAVWTRFQEELNRKLTDAFEARTPDEESPVGGREESEAEEDRALEAFAVPLSQLEDERVRVEKLLALARRAYDKGEESKFDRLHELLREPRFANQKLIVFTEYRDTMEFLARRFDGLGFAGRIARIHGGMSTEERDDQVEFFRRGLYDAGAQILVATDAAGEGINLQFCWAMVNYDIPWNPARLEQRMGRIHRYGQQHDPVVIANL
ncbi:helix-turn-helix domain-containing protein, partial [candidate division WOR-3 bacterium]|nr:helix-turn-helix domain-containing protein [candidate division WOR-3 bacterium]